MVITQNTGDRGETTKATRASGVEGRSGVAAFSADEVTASLAHPNAAPASLDPARITGVDVDQVVVTAESARRVA